MRLWAVRVPRTMAEQYRRKLAHEGLIHHSALIRKDGPDVLIPVTGKIDTIVLGPSMDSVVLVEAEFEPKSENHTLEHILGFSPAFDVIGDIAVINADDPEAARVAQALIDYRKNIKVVLGFQGPVSGEFRTRDMVVLAGEHRTWTIHTEYGCRYKVDLARAYFTPRLGTERKRAADKVKPGQTVVDMFAGVGPFSILIAKTVPGCTVVAIDKNPAAVQLLKENIKINHLDNVTAVEDDVRNVALDLQGSADHVIMNLPHSARQFLDSAILVAREGGLVHFYDITPEDDLYGSSWEFIRKAALRQGEKVTCVQKRMVRTYAPYQYNVCIEFLVNSQ